MPANTPPKPDPTPAATTTQAAPAPTEPGAVDVPAVRAKLSPGEGVLTQEAVHRLAGRLPAGVYQFTGSIATQYLEVPITARPADGDTPATIADWPFSAPDDGRWEPSKRKPNQVADNAAPLTSEE
jgi:hypothetical protein